MALTSDVEGKCQIAALASVCMVVTKMQHQLLEQCEEGNPLEGLDTEKESGRK